MTDANVRNTKMDPRSRKDDLLREMITARESIIAEVDKLSPDQIQVKYLGSWSVIELIAHLIGWDETNSQAIQNLREGRLPEFYSHRDPDWRSYNAILVDRYMVDDFSRLISAVKESFARLVRLVESIDPKEIDRDWGVRYKGYRVTIGRLLESETHDEQDHARQLDSFFSRQPRDV